MPTLNNLQGLRFLAFILVYLNHAYWMVSSSKLFDYGARGVEVFFVLSGWLIAYNFSNKSNKELDSSWAACFIYLRDKLKNSIFYIF